MTLVEMIDRAAAAAAAGRCEEAIKELPDGFLVHLRDALLIYLNKGDLVVAMLGPKGKGATGNPQANTKSQRRAEMIVAAVAAAEQAGFVHGDDAYGEAASFLTKYGIPIGWAAPGTQKQITSIRKEYNRLRKTTKIDTNPEVYTFFGMAFMWMSARRDKK